MRRMRLRRIEHPQRNPHRRLGPDDSRRLRRDRGSRRQPRGDPPRWSSAQFRPGLRQTRRGRDQAQPPRRHHLHPHPRSHPRVLRKRLGALPHQGRVGQIFNVQHSTLKDQRSEEVAPFRLWKLGVGRFFRRRGPPAMRSPVSPLAIPISPPRSASPAPRGGNRQEGGG